MNDSVKLLSLAVAAPEHVIYQSDAAETAARLFSSRFADFRHLARVFGNAGIYKRHAARPLSWFEQPHAWHDRMEAYSEVAGQLFIEVTNKALDFLSEIHECCDFGILLHQIANARLCFESFFESDTNFFWNQFRNDVNFGKRHSHYAADVANRGTRLQSSVCDNL